MRSILHACALTSIFTNSARVTESSGRYNEALFTIPLEPIQEARGANIIRAAISSANGDEVMS